MWPISFFAITIFFSFFWVFKRPASLLIKPTILNLPVVFSILFLIYYAQHYLVAEIITSYGVYQWLILSDDQKHSAVAFLVLYLVFFWAGFISYTRRKKPRAINVSKRINRFPHVLWVINLLALGFYIYITGGLESFFKNHREAVYSHQWLLTAESVMIIKTRAVATAIMMVSVVVGGYFAGKNPKADKLEKIIYYSLPVPITLVKVALLSRGVFLFLLLFFIAKWVSSRHKHKRLFLKLTVSFVVLLIGIIYIYIIRIVHDQGIDQQSLIYLGSRSVSGLSGFFDTYAISTKGGEGFFRVVLELLPIPSFIYTSPYDNNLSSLILDADSGSASPMPFIGEVYYNLGWFGLLFASAQGLVVALINNRVANKDERYFGWWVAMYIATIYSFIYMPHSGIRSCTRLIAWVVLLFMVRKVFYDLFRRANFLR